MTSFCYLLSYGMSKKPQDALEREGPVGSGDYALTDTETGSGVWIRVRGVMVHIYVTDEGVVTDMHTENDPSVASAYAYFSKGEGAEE